ncbi:MAG: flippase [Patescibacteria group bacterium]
MNLFQRVALNTIVQILGRAGVVFITILITAILTRSLGTEGFGNYVFILALVMLFVSISDWGSGMISVREAAKGKTEEEKIFGNALLFRLFLATVSFLIINFLIRLVPKFETLVLPTTIASALIFFLSIRTSCNIIFQTKLHFENIAMIELVSSGLFLLFLLLILKFSLSLKIIFFGLTLSSTIAAILGLILARRVTSFNFKIESKLIKKIFWESLPTGALLMLFTIYNRIDIIILQGFKGSTPVGIYGLAYKVHENLILGAAYLMNALFPIISKYADERGLSDRLTLIYKKSFDVLFLAGTILVFLVFIFAPLVIAIIGGPQFSQSITALRILVFATFLAYFNHLTGYSLIALGKQKVSLAVAIIALVWNVVLNLVFIPRYSYIAAAVVTIATEGLVLILTSAYLARKFSLKPSFTFPKTLVEIIKTRGKIF